MKHIGELLGAGDPLNRELGVRYITARIAGYGIEELYRFVTESIAVVCNEGTLREMMEDAPEDFRADLEEFIRMPTRVGMLRMMKCDEE
ncbi:hypothetical protein M0R72_00640 [Candidatus Pacearchaeota archaeon]|jgi:hypothetical protein|nr:hypothetical protein [Candidatus Pacearchaeota archaeon]